MTTSPYVTRYREASRRGAGFKFNGARLAAAYPARSKAARFIGLEASWAV